MCGLVGEVYLLKKKKKKKTEWNQAPLIKILATNGLQEEQGAGRGSLTKPGGGGRRSQPRRRKRTSWMPLLIFFLSLVVTFNSVYLALVIAGWRSELDQNCTSYSFRNIQQKKTFFNIWSREQILSNQLVSQRLLLSLSCQCITYPNTLLLNWSVSKLYIYFRLFVGRISDFFT